MYMVSFVYACLPRLIAWRCRRNWAEICRTGQKTCWTGPRYWRCGEARIFEMSLISFRCVTDETWVISRWVSNGTCETATVAPRFKRAPPFPLTISCGTSALATVMGQGHLRVRSSLFFFLFGLMSLRLQNHLPFYLCLIGASTGRKLENAMRELCGAKTRDGVEWVAIYHCCFCFV